MYLFPLITQNFKICQDAILPLNAVSESKLPLFVFTRLGLYLFIWNQRKKKLIFFQILENRTMP